MNTTGSKAALYAWAIAILWVTQAWAQSPAVPGKAPQDATAPGKILADAQTAYQALDTCKAEGTTVMSLEMDGKSGKTEVAFSILLKKPNLYLITWSAKSDMPEMDLSGAVWSDGTQPYLFRDETRSVPGAKVVFTRLKDDETALTLQAGGVLGTPLRIPLLFLPALKDRPAPMSEMKDPKLQADEKVAGEDCYVVSGATATSKEETVWISKSKHLILKYVHSLEPPEGGSTIPAMTDEEIDKLMKRGGQEVTEAKKKAMKESMAKMAEGMKTVKTKGSSIEMYTNISSPDLNPKDFQYTPPEGAVAKQASPGSGTSNAQPTSATASGQR